MWSNPYQLGVDDYDLRADRENRAKIDAAVPRARAENLIIKMSCFNKKEADDLRGYAFARYPDVEFVFTWLVFGTRS